MWTKIKNIMIIAVLWPVVQALRAWDMYQFRRWVRICLSMQIVRPDQVDMWERDIKGLPRQDMRGVYIRKMRSLYDDHMAKQEASA